MTDKFEHSTDFGLIDDKGRRIGAVAGISRGTSGRLRVRVNPTRDGREYGSSSLYPIASEAEFWPTVDAKFMAMRKRYARQFREVGL